MIARSQKRLLLVLILGIGPVVVACGQKGALYLPKKTSPSPPVEANPEATASKGS